MARTLGQSTPQAIKDAPELELGLSLYYSAFFELDSDRPTGFSVGRIPFSSMIKYMEFYGIDGFEERETFTFLLRKMDDAFITDQTEKSKRESQKAKQDGKKPQRSSQYPRR